MEINSMDSFDQKLLILYVFSNTGKEIILTKWITGLGWPIEQGFIFSLSPKYNLKTISVEICWKLTIFAITKLSSTKQKN